MINFTITTKPKGDQVEWELRSNIPALMTPDRQIAKGVASSEQAAQAAGMRAWNEWIREQSN